MGLADVAPSWAPPKPLSTMTDDELELAVRRACYGSEQAFHRARVMRAQAAHDVASGVTRPITGRFPYFPGE